LLFCMEFNAHCLWHAADVGDKAAK